MTPPTLFPDRFLATVAAIPDAVAVRDDRGSISFGALHHRARGLAGALVTAGVRPDTAVAVRIGRTRNLLVAVLAVLRAGGAFIPVDPDDPPARQRFVVRDSGATLVLSETGDGPPLGPPTLHPDRPGAPGTVVLPRIHPEQTAYVMYTSGSTGTPKGVAVPHRALAAYLDWAAMRYRADRPVVAHTSPAFDLTVTTLLAPLAGGGGVRLVRSSDPLELDAVWRERSWGLVKLTPSHLDALAAARRVTGDQPPAVDVLVVGGEAVRPEQVRPWLAAGRATRVVNEYGPTEATVGCCAHEVSGTDDPVPIGRPVPYARVTIAGGGAVDPGELLVAGVGLAHGYLGRPGATAERFRPDPDGHGARRYHTGDLASLGPDATLRFHGRTDRQLKIRGHRVEPGEVEAALRASPSVAAAAVIAEPTRTGDRLVAYVVAVADSGFDAAAVRRELAGRLPGYAVPARVVCLPELPLTTNGKVDLGALAQHRRRSLAQLLARLEAEPDEGRPEPAVGEPTASGGPAA
ncbi:amino acid adenylation domain-containing protein [Micromonospora okii]|uniref:amino acid adenylation domain-containing protein n=1 Tax=Micromonospora okii TaxID=1182970 RepID=UPI001E44CE70|nr:amino acid adenylation domain-containing protein [Micromonospora okii]